MDNLEFRLSTYNFSSHIAKLEWDPWDQPIIQLRNGQSYALTITSGQDPARLRNMSKSEWGDIARRIDTILTNKGVWPHEQAALPMECSYDNLVINGKGVTYQGRTYCHTTDTNTLADYQAIVTAVRQRLASLPSSAAPTPTTDRTARPAAQGTPTPLQQLPSRSPIDPHKAPPTAGAVVLEASARKAVTSHIDREVAIINRRNPNLIPRLTELLVSAFRQRIAKEAMELPRVSQTGIEQNALLQAVDVLVDDICLQQFRAALEDDIDRLLRQKTIQQDIVKTITDVYKKTLEGFKHITLKTRLEELLTPDSLTRSIAVCTERRRSFLSKLTAKLQTAADSRAVKLAKVMGIGGLKLGCKVVLGVVRLGGRVLVG